MQYYDLSAKNNYNFERPFLYLARKLTDEPDLTFVEAPALEPPEFEMDQEMIANMEQELAAAQQLPLPDLGDDDDF